MPARFSFLFLLLFFCKCPNNILLKDQFMILILKFHLSQPQYILNANDFIVLEYVNTYKSGVFNSNTKKYNKPIFLKINYTGNKPYTEEYNGLLGSKDFGKIYLLPNINVLDEVIIKASAPPIRVKKTPWNLMHRHIRSVSMPM